MSPQFVDFNHDGQLDMVAGTFDGSPHIAFGTGEGYRQPEQILDRNGDRIMLNQFWNFDTKKWESTTRFDARGHNTDGEHGTSAWAMDWDGDGDLDLLLGDHNKGRLYRRMNDGTADKPQFGTVNEPVLAGGQPLQLPGTITTMRLCDWNGDGKLDLLLGSMGDPYQQGPGGGVYLFLNTGETTPVYGKPMVLVEPSKKDGDGPVRPDSGLYMDAADVDGDGDLDLVVGGYSHWQPPAKPLDDAQQARVAELRQQIEALNQKSVALNRALYADASSGDGAAAEQKRAEILKTQQAERTEMNRERSKAQAELDELAPGPMRVSYVWLYDNMTAPAK